MTLRRIYSWTAALSFLKGGNFSRLPRADSTPCVARLQRPPLHFLKATTSTTPFASSKPAFSCSLSSLDWQHDLSSVHNCGGHPYRYIYLIYYTISLYILYYIATIYIHTLHAAHLCERSSAARGQKALSQPRRPSPRLWSTWTARPTRSNPQTALSVSGESERKLSSPSKSPSAAHVFAHSYRLCLSACLLLAGCWPGQLG